MSGKPDRPKDHPSAQDKHGKEQYKRHVDGHIGIGGQLEVHPPADAIKEEKSEQEDQRSYREKNFIVSIITLFSVIIYAGLTYWQGHTTKKAADAAASAAQTAKDTLDTHQRTIPSRRTGMAVRRHDRH
jgi:hypothetical protein